MFADLWQQVAYNIDTCQSEVLKVKGNNKDILQFKQNVGKYLELLKRFVKHYVLITY